MLSCFHDCVRQLTCFALFANRTVFQFVSFIVKDCFGEETFCHKSGSVAQKTYLPDADLDVVIFTDDDTQDWFIRLNQALCLASVASSGD